MNVPVIVAATFQRAPFARKVAFHRNRELMWKPEVELAFVEQSPALSEVPAPSASLIRDVFISLPSDWVGSVYFAWSPETGWTVTAPIREEFLRDVCGFWQSPVARLP